MADSGRNFLNIIPQGQQGIQGPQGPQGPQGIQGIQGPAGPIVPLELLSDVAITSVQDNDVLTYNSSTLQWENDINMSTNIYSNDGTMSGTRTIDGDGNILLWQNQSNMTFDVNSLLSLIVGSQSLAFTPSLSSFVGNTQINGQLDMLSSNKIINLSDATNPQDAITKNQFDNRSSVTTSSNLGAGQGVFKQKLLNNLEFKGLTSSDSTITLSNNTTDVNMIVNPNLNITSLTMTGNINLQNNNLLNATVINSAQLNTNSVSTLSTSQVTFVSPINYQFFGTNHTYKNGGTTTLDYDTNYQATLLKHKIYGGLLFSDTELRSIAVEGDYNSTTYDNIINIRNDGQIIMGQIVTEFPDNTKDYIITLDSTTDILYARQASTIANSSDLKTNLNSLDDVTITTPSTDDHLVYNGSIWVNSAPVITTGHLYFNNISSPLTPSMTQNVWTEISGLSSSDLSNVTFTSNGLDVGANGGIYAVSFSCSLKETGGSEKAYEMGIALDSADPTAPYILGSQELSDECVNASYTIVITVSNNTNIKPQVRNLDDDDDLNLCSVHFTIVKI